MNDSAPSRTRLLAVFAVLLLASAVMANLSANLRHMHMPGGWSGAVIDIASPLAGGDTAENVIGSWKAWEAYIDGRVFPEGRVASPPGWIVSLSLLVDSIFFAPALALLLSGLGRRRVRVEPERWKEWLGQVPMFAALYLASDLAENALTGAEVFYGFSHWFVRICSGFKVAFLVLCAIPILLSFFDRRRADVPGVVRLGPMLRRLRVALLAAVLLGIVLLSLPASARPQLADVMRTWVPGDDMGALGWALAAVATLALAVWATGVLSMTRRPETSPAASDRFLFWKLMGVILAFAAAGIALKAKVLHPTALVVAVSMLISYLLMQFVPMAGSGEPAESCGNARRVLATATAAPFFLLTLAYVRYADLIGVLKPKLVVISVCFPLLLIAIAVYGLVSRSKVPTLDPGQDLLPEAKRYRLRAWSLLSLAAAGALAAGIWLAVDPLGAGWAVGSVAVLILGVLVTTVVLGAAEQLFWASPRGLFRLVRLSRVPVASAALILFLLPDLLDKDVPYHAARVISGSEREDLTLDQLATSFRSEMARDGREVVPLFVIASAGGGARAAYWTLLIENCLFAGVSPAGETLDACDEPMPWSKARFVSGISGGSVGLAMFESNQLAARGAVDTERVFRDGFLDPTIAAMVLRDAANALLRDDRTNGISPDRAGILEQAWETRLPAIRRKFFTSELRAGRGHFPLLMLNSASVGDGCRLNVSVADLAPTGDPETRGPLPSCRLLEQPPAPWPSAGTPLVSTRDLVDFVCSPEDLLMSTAALLSARFPFVSPTGSLDACGRKGETAVRIYAVDGGLVDSSAASPLAELLPPFIREVEGAFGVEDRPCVQPVVLQIDNGYADVTATSGAARPGELNAPLAGLGAVSGSRADAARQALYLAAQPRCPGTTGRTYLHLFPDSRPGIEAPLGWSLSMASRRDLRQQMASARNRHVLCTAKQWLGSDRTCPELRPDPHHVQPDEITLGGFNATLILAAILALYAVRGSRMMAFILGRRRQDTTQTPAKATK